MTGKKKTAQASIEAMYRVFTVPEAPDSTLSRIDQDISRNLAGFLQEHIVAVERDLAEVEKDFADYNIPEKPIFVSEQAQFLLDKLVANSVHTASPAFIGHMTSALPYFMLPLSKIMIALNQNLVKTETSKAFTPMERQVLGMIHRLVYQEDGAFYRKWMHDPRHTLGVMCSGGTIANLTALWVARNHAFPAEGSFRGLHQEGLYRALKYYGYEGAAILVSKRGHYSLRKAADVLGFGRDALVSVETDDDNRILPDALREKCLELQKQKIKVLAICGVAGTTETGNVDPLDAVADIAREFGAHYHVDAAWGGPTLFSRSHKHLLRGIEKADSVTFDAHKQLYVPMGAGLVVFKDPALASSVEHHAQYIIRKGSRDLGSTTLEGSRPGMSMLIHSGLRILGREGYEILIDQGIEKARTFAGMIDAEPDFELVTRPELNILTYRYCPEPVQRALALADEFQAEKMNTCLNRITKFIQKTQRERGKAFVSRTRLEPARYYHFPCIVFRVVLANPLTTRDILADILKEQRMLAQEEGIADEMSILHQMAEAVLKQRQPGARQA
ncbi:pyridoxal-dependent aspartate 1-decarboxylase PanP [Marinobacter lutaoensis]|jgi:glutamate decarboxylase|uniref:Glutamate decarboxylase n=1 Tax=Marinobacter lutaoensis TaxID=135739 RepID=A0A1V2DS51_9GAMM|nr:putative pyridoxal-dependent aspartate 1-decarboxylase [Marinobacter lutaoensis]MBE02600.1 putative pyridoxal-dependent aspartate 1-decarboxylase [Marinobacter sp.]MBI43139.1 putative pyridoxal-dependent aspartate 1-decarboxylase [Oceanospirillales bacterium]NVD36911.1 putative pyridoxal-dependent aspartate 1-decarboxylase [Marinobacter lutaoensis]ONF43508.1 glutamate decarboxylase [Marinobacter lutaoensis]|tara:strand:- start:7900 stop:9576 length:1677 start_codon:yes stop_codon:yes gene_type:complete